MIYLTMFYQLHTTALNSGFGYLRHNPSTLLQIPSPTEKHLNLDYLCPCRDSNLRFPEYILHQYAPQDLITSIITQYLHVTYALNVLPPNTCMHMSPCTP